MLINLFHICFRLFCTQRTHVTCSSFFIHSSLFFLSLSLFFREFCHIVYVCKFIKKRKKKRNAQRKMNIKASKASFELLCSIKHSNYISSYVESKTWTDRTVLFDWLLLMKQATSIHLYCVLSYCIIHPIEFVVRARGQKNHPTCTFTIGSRPTMGQKKGREERRTGKQIW